MIISARSTACSKVYLKLNICISYIQLMETVSKIMSLQYNRFENVVLSILFTTGLAILCEHAGTRPVAGKSAKNHAHIFVKCQVKSNSYLWKLPMTSETSGVKSVENDLYYDCKHFDIMTLY